MKTLYITRGNNIVVDKESNTANKLKTCRQSIDDIFLVKEPMHVVYGSGEYLKELDVDKDDIIITFYNGYFKDLIVVAKSKDWVENLIGCDKKEQEEKERWAELKTLNTHNRNESTNEQEQ